MMMKAMKKVFDVPKLVLKRKGDVFKKRFTENVDFVYTRPLKLKPKVRMMARIAMII